MGGVLTLTSFMTDFKFTSHQSTKTNSIAVGIQQAGALVGCFAIYSIASAYGRRIAIALCSFVFVIGAMLQTINTRSLPAFYVARVIAGLGLGGSSVVISMFNSEMAPKEIRGRLGSFYQLMYTLG
jgi:MFS family permease